MKKKSTPPVSPAVKRTSLRDLAEYLGVSQTTVSLVLNNAPQAKNLTPETRKRVLEAAKAHNYRPSYFARSLAKGRSESIGVIAPDHSDPYFAVVMAGVEKYLVSKHYLYFTSCHYWIPELLEEYPRLLQERGAEGLLLLGTNAYFDSPLPVVAISAHVERPGVTNIILDHRLAAQLALEHLYQLGHRKIAFMQGHEHTSDSMHRWEATMATAQEMGIQVRPELQLKIESDSCSPSVGYAPVKRLLSRTRDFTALFCFNDTAAIGAIRALTECGLEVPRDVSVLGFDDVVGAAFHVPSLTTIRQPMAKMGQLASKLLLDRIAHPTKPYEQEILMRPQLVIRESTAAVRT
ncbi:MAG: LacI family DNA-binding transcriptional regulator [Acidobacteriota bacterium]|nr:LacI family DNA-binding transcriptional regulator [Acidobacteriota bacterium]